MKLTGIRSRAENWVNEPIKRELFFDDPQQKLDKALMGHSERDALQAAIAMEHLGVWQAMHGIVSVLSGDPGGWQQLKLSISYVSWHFKVVYDSYLRDTRENKQLRFMLNEPALWFAQALALGCTDEARWLGDRLVDHFRGKLFGIWPQTPLEPFLSRLHCRSRRQSDEPLERGLGVYQQIIDTWDRDQGSFSRALVAACEQHLIETDDPNDDGFPAFMNWPHIYFPVEILAIANVRRDLQMPMPEIDHPLMQTPLAKVPPNIETPADTLLRQAVAHIKKILPQI